jgi:glycosyltransferase involved in cell wall biosynthesis
MTPATPALSIILPCLNEAESLKSLLPALRHHQPEAEIIVVDDGSSDDSVAVAQAAQVTVIRHPYRMGNGAAIKTGARAATGKILVFMDADGQHQPQDVARLLASLCTHERTRYGDRRTRSGFPSQLGPFYWRMAFTIV